MQYTTEWDLSRYYYTGLDDPKLLETEQTILDHVASFAQKYGPTLETFTQAKDILTFYRDYEALMAAMIRPSYYFFYLSSLDTQDTEIQKRQWAYSYLMTEASNLLLFIPQAWKKIGRERILAWAHDPLLAWFQNDLIQTSEMLRYVLGEKEEYVLNMKSRPLSLANDLHDGLTGSYEFTMAIDSEVKTLTEEEVRSYRQHPDRTLRKEAYDALRRVYNTKQNQITLGTIFTSIVKDWSSEMRIRGYESILAQRNLGEQLDDSTVDMLLSEVEQAYPLYERFLRKKASLLGLPFDTKDGWWFAIWDTSAPIGTMERHFSLEEAFDLHLRVMQDFDEEFYTYSLEMMTTGRIDAFPKFWKRSGAFASYRKDEKSMVLLNFVGKLRDVSTISHELGHAIHGHLSQAQEWAVYDSPLSLAETASIFSEMLLGEKLKTMISGEEYKGYLNERLSDIFATIFRQVQYVSFERRVHADILWGKELTYKELNALWRESQIEFLGKNVRFDVEQENESGWSMIPHIFHTPFYCYSYVFGNILVFSLYHRYKQDPKFKEDYKNILRAWGSMRPKDLLMQYGIDIDSRDFYRAGIQEVEKLVEEFETLS